MDLAGFPAPTADVALIQTALEKAGMTPGPIDGIFGPRTLGSLLRWNARTTRHRGHIVVYEVICPLIEAHGTGRTQ